MPGFHPLGGTLLGGFAQPVDLVVVQREADDGPAFECCSFYDRAFQTCEPTDWTEEAPEADIWTPVNDNASTWADRSLVAATWARTGRC